MPITTHPAVPGGQPVEASLTTNWITRAEMATLMKRSEDTIRRLEKKHHLATREGEAGRTLVCVADFVDRGLIRPDALTVGATPAESAEVLRARETITALKAQVAELTGRLTEADLVRDTLREQLAVKDKQITHQLNQVTQLTQVLGRLGQVGGAA